MENLYQDENGVYHVISSSQLTNTIAEAIDVSKKEDKVITFVFNGVTINIKSDSDPKLLYRDGMRALSGYIDKNVGPYPQPILTDEEKANDKRIEAEKGRQWREQQREIEAEETAKRKRLAEAPPMEKADPDAWGRALWAYQNDFEEAVFAYAQRWARLMQVDMAKYKTVAEVAYSTSIEADIDGIRSDNLRNAVVILAFSWRYGDELLRWYRETHN